jgi:hypothetical protein
MRELDVVVVKTPANDGHDGERQFCGYSFEWPDGDAVSVGIDRFCQLGVRFLVGKSRSELSRIKLTLLAVTVQSRDQPYPKGRFRRFMIRSDGVLCLVDGTATQVQFSGEDDERVLHWLGWTHEDLWVDIGVRYEEEGNKLREGVVGPYPARVQGVSEGKLHTRFGQAI